MTITDIFDAVRDGTYEDFMEYYSGNANLVHEKFGLNLLQFALVNDKNSEEKLKIIRVLLKEGVDVNFLNKKSRRKALHQFYFSVIRPTLEYMFMITKLLVENGVNLNEEDKYGAIPLKKVATNIEIIYNENDLRLYSFNMSYSRIIIFYGGGK